MSVSGVQNALKFIFLFGLFPGHFFIDFCIEFPTFGIFESWFSHGKYCKNLCFINNVFDRFWDGILSFFDSLGNCFPDFFNLENRFENRRIFVMKPDPRKWIW